MSTSTGAPEPEVPAPPSPAQERGPRGASPARPRRRSWLPVFAGFVVGVLAGVVGVGLLDVGTPELVSAQGAGRSASPRPSASVEVGSLAQVNVACLRVINEAQDVYAALSGLNDAVDEVDLQALDEIVRRLQPVEPRLARDLQDCQVSVQPSTAPDGGAPPAVPPPATGAASPTTAASPVVPPPAEPATGPAVPTSAPS